MDEDHVSLFEPGGLQHLK